MGTFTTPSHVRLATSLVVLLGLALSRPAPAVAQSGSAADPWLGVPLPGGLVLPPQLAVLRDTDFGAPPTTVPAGEQANTDLEGEPIRDLVRDIVAFSTQSRANGELMWGARLRLPGGRGYRAVGL